MKRKSYNAFLNSLEHSWNHNLGHIRPECTKNIRLVSFRLLFFLFFFFFCGFGLNFLFVLVFSSQFFLPLYRGNRFTLYVVDTLFQVIHYMDNLPVKNNEPKLKIIRKYVDAVVRLSVLFFYFLYDGFVYQVFFKI